MGEIQPKLLLFMPFFQELTYRSYTSTIFTHDGSNDADSRKDVPFLETFHIAPHLGGQKPQKLLILGRE